MMYGFYSHKQANFGGTAYYSRPDGSEVAVTEIAEKDERPQGNKWDDLVPVGPVVKFLHSNKHLRCREY